MGRADATFWLAWHLARSNDPEASERMWQTALGMDDGRAACLLGMYFLERGDSVAAERALLRADELEYGHAACVIGHMWDDQV